MILPLFAMLAGLALLVWSADRFIDGAAVTARYAGMSPLLIGMLIIGFGTSAPEMVVSALAAVDGNPGLALGNAYGSNITNIALIIGIVAVIKPIAVHKQVLTRELPILLGVTLIAGAQLLDGELSRWDGIILLAVFFLIMGWTTIRGLRGESGALAEDVDVEEITEKTMPLSAAIGWLLIGLVLLVASSRMLVWGAVSVAQTLGISDVIIGLTIVAIGTSLPELASSMAAIRKNQHDMALGNVVGSGLFNTLAVVGIASTIHPLAIEPELLYRDWVVMTVLTVALLIMGWGRKGRLGRVNRLEGALFLVCYGAYTGYLIYNVLSVARGAL